MSPKKPTKKELEKHVKELEKQLADVTMEREILKKAVSIFSKAQ